jgi:PRTRC genetic system protein E
MSTPITATAEGFFVQLMPLLADRTLMVIVSKSDDQHVTLSVVPKRMKDGESPALTTPLCCTGTPAELDRDLPSHLRDFVAGQVTLSNNLAQIQREREEAEKAAREELKKKQKTVGNGGAKGKAPEARPPEQEKVAPAPPQPPMMSLFDAPAGQEPQAVVQSDLTVPDQSSGRSITTTTTATTATTTTTTTTSSQEECDERGV